jgi:preprotein translocase subunit SecG
MFTFLLVVQALIAASLVGVILMQQSEGGGLGMGGSPTGLMSARGAANFLTRATGVLAVSFVALSIALAVLATQKAAPTTIDTSLARKPLPTTPAPAPVVPLSGDPAAQPGTQPGVAAPVVPSAEPAVPLAATPKPIERRAVTPRPAAPAVAAPVTPPPVAATVPAPATGGNSN